MSHHLRAGAAIADITPCGPLHLFGYPHVERIREGAHYPLLSSALYLTDERTQVFFIANDVIFVSKGLVARARKRICSATGAPEDHILISATHTHSGPDTVRYLSNEDDPTVPPPDAAYLTKLEDGIVEASRLAFDRARDAEIGLTVADGSCVGRNRRDAAGLSEPDTPVLVARELDGGPPIAAILVCSMHPTVLHEDSKLVSGDFPAFTRAYLQKRALGRDCPVLHHTGACGNQSPRRVIHANTFDEARRLGHALGAAVEHSLQGMQFMNYASVACCSTGVRLPVRTFPLEQEAAASLAAALFHFEKLRRSGVSRAELRTAECDVFGAQETLTLARAAAAGRVEPAAESCMPAEIQVIRVGPWSFVAWPGELFVEFALEIRGEFPNAYVITMANGELQGYLVTEEAVREGGYEASNALFKSPDSGRIVVEATRGLLRAMTSEIAR